MTVTFADVVAVVGLVTQLLVVAGVGIAVKQLIDQNRQQHRDFENMYVQRYWMIVDRLSAEYVLRGRRQELSESDTLACHAYLQLCEDEVDLYEAGRITKDTWAIWKAGIDYALAEEPFREILEKSSAESFTTLRRYIQDGVLVPRYRGTKAALRGL